MNLGSAFVEADVSYPVRSVLDLPHPGLHVRSPERSKETPQHSIRLALFRVCSGWRVLKPHCQLGY
jgi:hypothetical protein